MTQLEALLFTLQVILVCSLIVGLAVFVRALMYEAEDRRSRNNRTVER